MMRAISLDAKELAEKEFMEKALNFIANTYAIYLSPNEQGKSCSLRKIIEQIKLGLETDVPGPKENYTYLNEKISEVLDLEASFVDEAIWQRAISLKDYGCSGIIRKSRENLEENAKSFLVKWQAEKKHNTVSKPQILSLEQIHNQLKQVLFGKIELKACGVLQGYSALEGYIDSLHDEVNNRLGEPMYLMGEDKFNCYALCAKLIDFINDNKSSIKLNIQIAQIICHFLQLDEFNRCEYENDDNIKNILKNKDLSFEEFAEQAKSTVAQYTKMAQDLNSACEEILSANKDLAVDAIAAEFKTKFTM